MRKIILLSTLAIFVISATQAQLKPNVEKSNIKTIVFSNAYGFLNNEYHIMECVTDGSFAPLTATIIK